MSEENKIDDNGDGLIDEKDGLFATCVAVTDQNGNTALIYGIDLLGAYADIVTAVRQQLLADETLADCGLAEDRIFITGSHSHMAPSINSAYNNEAIGPQYKIYIKWITDQMVQAGRNALADRASARMYKGTIDASDSNAAKSNIGETLNSLRSAKAEKVTVLSGANYLDREYNSVRHYQITEKEQKISGSKFVDTGKTITYVAGNAFNGDYRPVGNTRAHESDSNKRYIVSEVTPVSEADDKMHILEFRFDDTSKKSIVLLRWSGHLPNTTSVSDDKDINEANGKYTAFGGYTSYFQISSTMVNSLRYTLETKGYRACYLQGTSGNVNSVNALSPGSWMRYATGSEGSGDRTHVKNRHNIYGTELAEVALECLKNNMTAINKNGGDIRSIYKVYHSQRKTVTPFEYMAGLQYKAAGNSGNKVFRDMYYYVDGEGTPLIDSKGQPIKENVAGLTKVNQTTEVTITSVFHANTNVNDYPKNGTAGQDIHLYALTIGEDFSMVTASGELFDRYSRNGNLKENMWDEVGADYTNGASGYFGSLATFDFSKDSTQDGYAQGSYETMSNSYAPGTGESLVEELDIMLDFLKNGEAEVNPQGEICQHCQKYVTWKELTQGGEMDISTTLRSGHYYLAGDITLDDKQTAVGATSCLDLQGHTLTVKKSFEVMAESTLNIIDSVGNGKVVGQEAPKEGGVFNIKATATLNQYGGTLCYEGKPYADSYGNGGVLHVSGDFNMFGGLVEGATVNWVGGAIYIGETGKASFYGGKVTVGSATYAPCIGCYGTVQLSGNANVEKIYFMGDSQTDPDSLAFKGKFTGYADIHGLAENVDVGDNFAADISAANIVWSGGEKPWEKMVRIEGKNVYIGQLTKYSAINAEGEYVYTNDFERAAAAAATGGTLALNDNITEEAVINNDLHVELNGHNMDYVVVAKGKTLQVTDGRTADYDVADGCYGKVRLSLASKGVLQGKPATEEHDTYLMVAEGSNTYSFHAVDLSINAISLKIEHQGIYYRHEFAGDQAVAKEVISYGIALSVDKAPEEADLNATTSLKAEAGIVRGKNVVLTRFTDSFGNSTKTSVLVKGVMKKTSGYYTNYSNAGRPIYGRAYVRLADGTYVLGVTRQLSLQQMVEKMDAQWEKLGPQGKESLVNMYKDTSYQRIMRRWNIPNICTNG